mgnify:CR=1 FL=1
MRVFWTWTVAIGLLAAGCAHEAGEQRTDERQPAVAARLDTPLKLLERIRALARAGELEAIRPLVWDYSGPEGRSAADLVLQGIRDSDQQGDWDYSDQAISALIERHGDAFQVPPPELLDMLKAEFGRFDPRLRDMPAEAFRVLGGPRGIFVLLRHDGALRVLFWESMHALAQQPPR